MRKFALYRDPPDFDDHLGTCLPLNGPHVYMVDPTGLGLNVNPQIAGFDNFFYKKIKKSSFDPETVGGTIIFYDEDIPKNAYLYYRQFVSFCTHAKKLYFGYAPYGDDNPDEISSDTIIYTGSGISFTPLTSDWVSFSDNGIFLAGGTPEYHNSSTLYKADAEFISIDKSEITTSGILACAVSFTLLTPWYNEQNSEIYPIRPEPYGTYYRYSGRIGDVDGDLFGSILFDLYTSLTRVEFGITNFQTGEMIWHQNLNISTFIGYSDLSYCHLVYSSDPKDSKFQIEIADVWTHENSQKFDVIEYIDITQDVYYKIPLGIDVGFFVQLYGVSIDDPPAGQIQLFDYYRSV